MKLYATVTSERATKSQGGKRIETTIQNGNRDILLRMETFSADDARLPEYSKIVDGDIAFLVNLKSNIAFYLDKMKGERQKGEYCDECMSTPCQQL